ncbi:MAG TPA: hypothetical protein VLI69_04495 [Gammaproteobacteria bacterium]|nr:hypothetical protein [Gammaproteobacteria bacterium]
MQINLEILNNLNKSLRKAEALTIILGITNLEMVASDVIDNYLWALNDHVREARQLYNRLAAQIQITNE